MTKFKIKPINIQTAQFPLVQILCWYLNCLLSCQQ